MLDTTNKNLGFMISPMVGYWRESLANYWWAGDNGRFKSPHRWTERKWVEWMYGLLPYQPKCLFMVAPDVLADPWATRELAEQYCPTIRLQGYRAAYVSQDHADETDIPWDWFDCLFIGGTTEWKLSEASYALAKEAKDRGKWVHMGRVNSGRRMRAAQVSNVDSADGTHIAFKPTKRLGEVLGWLDQAQRQPSLS